MPLNINDAREAALIGRQRSQVWRQEFFLAWHAPDIKVSMIQWWKQMPAEVHRQLEMQNPKAYAVVKKRMEEMSNAR